MNPKIEKLRSKIAELKSAIDLAEQGSIRIPKPDAIAKLDRHLAHLQADGLRRVSNWVQGFSFPDHDEGILIRSQPADPTEPTAMLAALAPDALRARLVELLEAQYADAPETIATCDRTTWIETKRAELLRLEIDDYRESCAAKVMQRRDLDPRVLLGLA